MSRIKGEYVATIRFVMDFDKSEMTRSFDEVKQRLFDGYITDGIREVVTDQIFGDEYGTVTVTQQYAEINEVDDEPETENAE